MEKGSTNYAAPVTIGAEPFEESAILKSLKAFKLHWQCMLYHHGAGQLMLAFV